MDAEPVDTDSLVYWPTTWHFQTQSRKMYKPHYLTALITKQGVKLKLVFVDEMNQRIHIHFIIISSLIEQNFRKLMLVHKPQYKLVSDNQSTHCLLLAAYLSHWILSTICIFISLLLLVAPNMQLVLVTSF